VEKSGRRHHPRGSVRRASGFVLTGNSEIELQKDRPAKILLQSSYISAGKEQYQHVRHRL